MGLDHVVTRRLALLVLMAAAGPARAGDLLVEVRGVPSAEGRVLVAACQPDVPFPAGPCAETTAIAARPGTVLVALRNVPGGRFALSAFHDRDGDGRLGTDWLGRPTECIGFGNDAPIGRFGPPSFSRAALDVPDQGVTRTVITLRCE